MLVGLFSVKGSPGVTSSALALAAVWPRQVVMVEADPTGSDLSYRCRASHGGPVDAEPGLLRLAATVRSGVPGPQVLSDEAQALACGVQLVQGVAASAQSRGFGPIWSTIGQVCANAMVDVIVDLGRLERSSPVMAIAGAADVLLPVVSTTLESVLHLSNGLQDVMGALAQAGLVNVGPIIVGADESGRRDCADLDEVLHKAGLPTLPAQPIPYDPRALTRLERGERVEKLAKTPLIRGARQVAQNLTPAEVGAQR